MITNTYYYDPVRYNGKTDKGKLYHTVSVVDTPGEVGGVHTVSERTACITGWRNQRKSI